MLNLLFLIEEMSKSSLEFIAELIYPSKFKPSSWNTHSAIKLIYEHASGYLYKDNWYCGQYLFEPLKRLIWASKYRNNKIAVSICANLLTDQAIDILTEKLSPLCELVVLAPVPSTSHSLKERSFNHMQEISIVMRSQLVNFIYSDHDLNVLSISKTSLTRQSKTFNKEERFKKACNKFEASRLVSGKKVLLIDDVITTGATMSDCNRALHISGAVHIYCLAIAH